MKTIELPTTWTHTVTTRHSAGATPTITTLTFKVSNDLTGDDVAALLTRPLAINWQAAYRSADKDGNYKQIPAEATIIVEKPERRVSDPLKVYREVAAKTSGCKVDEVSDETALKVKALLEGILS
jgi:hypothetical protein